MFADITVGNIFGRMCIWSMKKLVDTRSTPMAWCNDVSSALIAETIWLHLIALNGFRRWLLVKIYVWGSQNYVLRNYRFSTMKHIFIWPTSDILYKMCCQFDYFVNFIFLGKCCLLMQQCFVSSRSSGNFFCFCRTMVAKFHHILLVYSSRVLSTYATIRPCSLCSFH